MGIKKKYNPIKLKLSKLFFNNLKKDADRKGEIIPLKQAKSVGVTFVVLNTGELEIVKKVLKQIVAMGIKPIALGYIPEKKPNDFYLSEKAFNFFYDKELDWLLRPKNAAAVEFQNTNFDILIDLGTYDYYPMQYLLYKSKAKFKVGWFTDGADGPFDFMMNIHRKEGHEYFISQVLHYLSKLN
jgi:hypothetical protein